MADLEFLVGVYAVMGLIFFVAVLGIWIWALIDILRSEFKDTAIKIAWVLMVIFLPLIGVLLYVVVGRSTKITKDAAMSNTKYDDLERIKQLFDNGVLSEAEFESEKEKIMNRI